MHHQSYFPIYYSHNDLNMDPNGNTKPVYTGHVAPVTGHFGQRFLALTATQGCLGYNKEFLRQTILEQEITFRDQVQELHQLYRRQKELLDEIKRNNFYKQHVHSSSQWLSNSLTSNVSVKSTQKTVHSSPVDSFAFSHPTNSVASNVCTLCTSTIGETTATASHTSQGVTSSNIVELSLFQSKRAQKKLLDLQLPADEYIDSGERESLKDFEVSGVSVLSSHSSNKAYPVAPVGNVKPLLACSSPTTFSSQMIDLTKFSGFKHMSHGTLDDHMNRKKLKMCRDIETDKIDAWNGWHKAGKSRSSLNSFGLHSYSQGLQIPAEIDQAHQITTHSTKKNGWHENGRTNMDAQILGSIHEVLNLNSPGKLGASHTTILEFPAHSGKVNSQVPLSSSCGQVDLTLGESLITRAAPCLSPDFSAINNSRMQCKSQTPLVDELDHSSRCRIIHEKGRSLQSSWSESHAKASATSGFLFQSYKCDLASEDDQSAKHMNCLDSIDLNSAGVVNLDDRDLTSPKSVFSQVFPSPSIVKKKHIEGSESQPNNCPLGSINNADHRKTGQSKKTRLFDINVPCDPTMDMVRLKDDQVGDHFKQSDLINLDPLVKDKQLSPRPASPKSIVAVDLEVLISSEKRESLAPRGGSEENKTDAGLQVSTGEDGDSLEELMKTAVDVLIAMSEVQPHLTDSKQCLASIYDNLIWFAGVVCSVEQGDAFLVSNSKPAEECEEISLFTTIDYFEAMTLKLTETSQEDYGSNITTLHNEKETCGMPLSTESSRGRTTRRAKKDFQREILPSLASLLRYEVSEDIQIIERLMKQQGLHCNWAIKTRKLGRNGRVREKKRSRVSMIASEESRICLLTLPHMAIPGLYLKDKGHVRLENMPRRPRGHRSRILSPHVTLSQEGWMRKWGGISFGQKAKKKHKQVQMLLPQLR